MSGKNVLPLHVGRQWWRNTCRYRQGGPAVGISPARCSVLHLFSSGSVAMAQHQLVDSSQNTFLNVLSSSFPFNFIGGQFPAMLLLCILADRIIRQPQRCCVGIVCSVGDVVRKIKTASVCCTKRTEVVLRVGGAARKFLTMQPPISSRPALLCYYFCYRRYSYRRNYTLS